MDGKLLERDGQLYKEVYLESNAILFSCHYWCVAQDRVLAAPTTANRFPAVNQNTSTTAKMITLPSRKSSKSFEIVVQTAFQMLVTCI